MHVCGGGVHVCGGGVKSAPGIHSHMHAVWF